MGRIGQAYRVKIRPDGRNGRRSIWRTALVVVFWLAVWQLAACAVGSPLLLAGPIDAAAALLRASATPDFWGIVAFSALRVVAGLVASFALALALAAASARFSAVCDLLAVPMLLMKSVPVVCVAVLLLLWTDSSGVSVLCVALVVLPAVYFSALEGVCNVDAGREELLDAFGVGRVRRTLVSTWPQVLPYVEGTARNIVGMAWKAGVAAELIGIPDGSIGERIYQSKLLLETGDLFAWTAVLVLASWLCEKAFLALLLASGSASRRLGLAGAFAREGMSDPGSARPEPSGTCEPARIAFAGVTAGYRDGPAVLEKVSFEVAPGGRACLFAPSGSGKTTALRLALGLARASAGRIEGPSCASCVFQETRLVEELSAEENVVLASPGRYSRRQAADLLAEILPGEALGRPVSGLSGGQRRRVELARALSHPGAAVLLDEPFSGLDEKSHELAAAFVLRHLGGRTLLVATHVAADADLLDASPLELHALVS